MGGAFISPQIGDATSAYANPAAIANLSFREIYMEMKYNRYTQEVPNYHREWTNYEYKFDGSGSEEFTESETSPSFISFVYPLKRLSFAIYKHELVNYKSNVYTRSFDMGGEWRAIYPTQSDVDVNINDYGVSGAVRILDNLNLGATVRFSHYEMDNELKRFGHDLSKSAWDVNYEESNVRSRWSVSESDDDISFILGVHYNPVKTLKIGMVYRQGPEFEGTEKFENGPSVTGEGYELRDYNNYTFKVPDSYGLGISYQFFDKLTLAFDYVRVEYSDLMDGFEISVAGDDVTSAVSPGDYDIDDANEYHIGAEYNFEKKDIMFSARVGYWYNPDHSIHHIGDDSTWRLIYSGGEDEHNYTFGLGMLYNNIGMDIAGNLSDHYNSFSISVVYQFDDEND